MQGFCVRRSPVFVKRFMKKATPATAVVKYLFADTGESGGELWDNVKGELEVTGTDGPTYNVRGIFNGSKKLAPFVGPETALSVKVDLGNPEKLAIDWDALGNGAVTSADRDEVARANEEAHDAVRASEPAQSVASSGDDVSAATSGWKSQYLASIEEGRRLGNLSEEEYEQAKRDLGEVGG